jgi:hypothetical protein
VVATAFCELLRWHHELQGLAAAEPHPPVLANLAVGGLRS